MDISTLATQIHPKSRCKSQRRLGWIRDRTSALYAMTQLAARWSCCSRRRCCSWSSCASRLGSRQYPFTPNRACRDAAPSPRAAASRSCLCPAFAVVTHAACARRLCPRVCAPGMRVAGPCRARPCGALPAARAAVPAPRALPWPRRLAQRTGPPSVPCRQSRSFPRFCQYLLERFSKVFGAPRCC